LKRAVNLDPDKRDESLSEYTFDLRHPNGKYLNSSPPLIERNPLLFWKSLAAILVCTILMLLISQHGVRHDNNGLKDTPIRTK